jgi:hypothetical protein
MSSAAPGCPRSDTEEVKAVKATHLTVIACVLIAVMMAVAAGAQDAAGMSGKITLRSGQVLEGNILLAEFGVVDGSGIGSKLREGGSLALQVGDKEVKIPSAQIASIEAVWDQNTADNPPSWEIKELKVTDKAGKVTSGKPTWVMCATSASVTLASGENKRVNAFPMSGLDFKPDNLIARVDLGGGAAPAPTAPTAPTAPVAPAPTAPTAPEPTAPTAPVAPAPTAPTAPVAPAPTAPTAPVAPAPTAPTAPVAPTVAPAPAPAPGAALAQNTMSFTIICPKCGQKITVTIRGDAVIATEHP